METFKIDSQAAIVPAPFQVRCDRFLPSRAIYDALAKLGERWLPFLIVNFRKATVVLPSGSVSTNDLYQHAPDIVRQEHSLHLIGPEAGDHWLEIFEEFRARGMLLVLFTDKSRDELLEGLRLYLAWFAQPNTLKTILDEGSDHLRRGVMTGVRAILLQTSAEEWFVYTRADEDCSWLQEGRKE